jgi:hypothetical protein
MRFQCHFQCRKHKNDVENACDGESHIKQNYTSKTQVQSTPKRQSNRIIVLLKGMLGVYFSSMEPIPKRNRIAFKLAGGSQGDPHHKTLQE